MAVVVERASEFSVERELKAVVRRDLGHWLDVVLLGSGDSVVHLEGCRRPCTGMRSRRWNLRKERVLVVVGPVDLEEALVKPSKLSEVTSCS